MTIYKIVLIEDTLCTQFFLNLFSAYVFILIVKGRFYYELRKSVGKYVHDLSKKDSTTFLVKYNWNDFLSPVPRVALWISRTSTDVKEQGQDWKGRYYSDMLNPRNFDGAYDKFGTGKIEDIIGWHSIIFYPEQGVMALTINHLKVDNRGKRWDSTGGYFLFRKCTSSVSP